MQPVALLLQRVAVLLLTVAVLLQPVAVLLQPMAVLVQAVAGGPTAPPRTPEASSWQWPENFHKMKEELVEAQAFFHASVYLVGIALEHKADC